MTRDLKKREFENDNDGFSMMKQNSQNLMEN